MHHVTAEHLECVDGAHNKFYRSYLLRRSDTNVAQLLVRHWGRRGAANGQWLVDPARGDQRIVRAAADIRFAKISKGYVSIYRTDMPVDIDFTGDIRSIRRQLPDAHRTALHEMFEQTWAQAVADLMCNVDETAATVALYNDWGATLRARNVARCGLAMLDEPTMYHDTARDRCAIAIPAGAYQALNSAFGAPVDVANGTVDDAETLRVALRLYTGTRGPYARLDAAIRDARRLFRR